MPMRPIRLHCRLLTKFIVRTERGAEALGPLLISQAEIEAQLRRRLAGAWRRGALVS
jgi:hypothetical protein